MKLIILTGILVVAASSPLQNDKQWPWQVGKVYHYDVTSHTVSSFEQGHSHGHGIKTKFIISVKAPGRLLVKLENSQYVPVKAHLSNTWELPSDLKYKRYKDLDQIFEIFVSGGRIVSVNFSSTLSITLENVLKGLIGALQLDLTDYDDETYQSVFTTMEADSVGICETLYSISPISAEWRREIPKLSSNEDPIEIVKAKNYGNCQKRVASVTGVPDVAVWTGLASGNEERQFITHNSETRLLIDKNGTIYKSQVMGFVYVSPIIYGKQKAEVYTHTKFFLDSVTNDEITWEMSQEFRSVNSLLYTADPSTSFFTPGDEENLAKAQKLLKEMSILLQNPNDIPKGKFEFNLLVYVLSALNTEQLTRLTNSIGVANTSKNVTENNMWFVYRDAVALTGTPEAFQQIKSWILNKKVEGFEAAELITSIGTSISNPSNELLEEFFYLATCEQVTQAKFLNNSALLASTKLFRSAGDDKFTVETVIPYLSNELKGAVETGNSNAVVYVTVLGNLAHPAVLNTFAPYFEGQITVSKYFRTQIVTSLRSLANKKDPYVRSMLYSIIRNTGEPFEVRVAAALNIFLACPTFDMMRILGYMAMNDPSTQVRAVLKSGINYAAELKDPRFAVLAKSAKAVLNLVPTEKFGSQYSTELMHDEYSNDGGFSFFREQSYIGSDDHFLPKYYRAALRIMGTGITEENQISLSLSSLGDLVHFYLLERNTKHWHQGFKFSAEKIIEMLSIKKKTHNPVEASIFIEILNQQKFFNFRQDDINTYLEMASDMHHQLRQSNLNYKYTKLLYNKKISVAFPLVSGMPFAFEYREPIACLADLHIADKGSFRFEFLASFTLNGIIDGSLGYMDTLGKTFAGAGIVKQLQIHLPLKVVYSGINEVTFEPLHPGKDVNILHFSVFPYTGIQKLNSLNYNVEFIERSVKTISQNAKYGYWTGMVYQLQASSYSSDYNNVENLLKNDILSTIGNLLYQKDMAQTKIELNYLGSESNVQKADFALFSSTWHNYMNWIEICWNLNPVSRAHCRELGKKITMGMSSPRVELLDFTAKFRGNKTIEYIFTAAYAHSYIESKFHTGLIALGNNNRLSADFKYDASKANIVPLNFETALKNKIKVFYEANINYEKTNINLKGYGKRSQEYTEILRTDVMANRCLEDINKDNYYQLDCHKMIAKAHAPDYFKAVVTYKDLNIIPIFHTRSDIYRTLKKVYLWEDEINPFEKTVGDKLDIEVQAFYNENFINYKIWSKYGQLQLNKVKGLWKYPYEAAMYGPNTFWERAVYYYKYTGLWNLPYCAVDGNKVKTFSGRSYDYSLTGSWHVVMVDEIDDIEQNLVILARRPNAHQEEIYISLDSGDHRFIELNIKPGNISIQTNSERISEGDLTKYWDQELSVPLLEYYSIAEDTQVFHISNGRIHMLYDQQRLVIFTDLHRSTTKGICGENSGQVQDDYMTPWGLVDRPDHYGASFSLDEDCVPETLALKTEAKSKAYQRVTKYTKIPRYV